MQNHLVLAIDGRSENRSEEVIPQFKFTVWVISNLCHLNDVVPQIGDSFRIPRVAALVVRDNEPVVLDDVAHRQDVCVQHDKSSIQHFHSVKATIQEAT